MDKKVTLQATITDDLIRKMSQWQEANPNATLTEIEVAVEAELAELRRQLVEAMVQEEKEASQKGPECPECGGAMVKNGRRKRKLQSKEGQTIQLDRQQWRCLSCGATLFPPG